MKIPQCTFLGFPVRNCIVGILFTRPIRLPLKNFPCNDLYSQAETVILFSVYEARGTTQISWKDNPTSTSKHLYGTMNWNWTEHRQQGSGLSKAGLDERLSTHGSQILHDYKMVYLSVCLRRFGVPWLDVQRQIKQIIVQLHFILAVPRV